MPPVSCWIAVLFASLLTSTPLAAQQQLNWTDRLESQTRAWNTFFHRLQKMHEHYLKTRRIRKSHRIGGYHSNPAFYREVDYFDVETGKLLSRVQYERLSLQRIHSIEIYIYGAGGRVIRDYSATFLPGHRNAPVQTLVNLHGYQHGLHAYRQFDASGNWIYEQCKGRWFDKDVWIDNDEPSVGTSPTLRAGEEYLACFGFIPFVATGYLDPTASIPAFRSLARKGALELDEDDVLRKRISRLTGRLLLSPDDAEYHLKRGSAYLQLRDFDKAVKDFSRAIELDPQLDRAYFGRGMALGRQGAFDKAIADLSTFIARNPRSSLAYTKRGVRHIWKGDLVRAEADLRRAVQLDPENAEAHDDLGVVLARRGQYEPAIKHFETTIRLDPKYQKAFHNLALVRHLQGKDQLALDIIDRALSLRLGPRSSLQLKANILKALGRHAEAMDAERTAASLPDNNWSERLSVR